MNLAAIKSHFYRDVNGPKPAEFPGADSVRDAFNAIDGFVLGVARDPVVVVIYGLCLPVTSLPPLVEVWRNSPLCMLYEIALYSGMVSSA